MAFEQSPHEAAESVVFDWQSGKEFTYDAISTTYEESKYGVFQADQEPRFYATYGYEPSELMKIDLGRDVFPVGHMRHTDSEVVQRMVRMQLRKPAQSKELSTEMIRTMRLTARLHDVGETRHPDLQELMDAFASDSLPGDIYHFSKKSEDEQKKSVIRQHIFEDLYPEIDEKYLKNTEEIIMMSDPNDYSTRFFRTAENLGYFMTGIKAAHIAVENAYNVKASYEIQESDGITDIFVPSFRLKQIGRMAVNVPLNWIDQLEAVKGDYPLVKQIIDSEETTRLLKTIELQFGDLRESNPRNNTSNDC